MLTAAKSSLTTLMKSSRQNQSWENIWKGNVVQNFANISTSNTWKNHSLFPSYDKKYHFRMIIFRRTLGYEWVNGELIYTWSMYV